MYPRVHLGKVRGVGIQTAGSGGRENFQGAEEDEVDLHRVQCNGGGVLP